MCSAPLGVARTRRIASLVARSAEVTFPAIFNLYAPIRGLVTMKEIATRLLVAEKKNSVSFSWETDLARRPAQREMEWDPPARLCAGAGLCLEQWRARGRGQHQGEARAGEGGSELKSGVR